MNAYPRLLVKGFKPFDLIELARRTEEIVCRDCERKYMAFYATRVYAGIATGYVVGCCLRCFFCWSEFSRDFPEFYGRFYSPEAFTKRTGAVPEAFELPFKAIEVLLDYGVSFHVAAMTDPRLMSEDERKELIERLAEIDPFVATNLEEEVCDPYETTIVRMAAYGLDPVKFFTGGVGLGREV